MLLTLQLRATEVLDDVLPVWWVIITAQIWLELSTENLQRSRLSDTVGSNKTQDLAWSWHGKTMELEAVGGITVSDLGLKVGWQVDNVDGAEWALLWADTASNAERLGDECDLGLGADFDTEATTADDWARLLALLSTFLRQASVGEIGAFLFVYPYLWLAL